jgi:HlyD family secretion protein
MQEDVKEIQDKIDNANIQLQQVQVLLRDATRFGDSEERQYWNSKIADYEADIVEYQEELQELLTDPEHSGAASSVTDIKNKQLAVQQAQANLVTVQNALDDAQKTLDEEKNSSQEIKAPFRGLITKVEVNEGDIVQRNATLIEIAEPDKFVANILVTERDIFSVKIGGDAAVSFDALTGLSFPATITKISPLATVQQGVVNYNVTVGLTSLKPSLPTQGKSNGGISPTGTPSATGIPGSSTGVPPSGSLAVQEIALKDGLSATVNIPIQQKDNILIIPSRAITRQGQESTVQVIQGADTQTRTVKTGLSDFSNTEITEGLNEGEQLMVRAASTSSSSGFPGTSGGGMIITDNLISFI